MPFWERTWQERADAIKLAYGDTEPPDSVYSFSLTDRLLCPGACALALPPCLASRDPRRHPRTDWLYLTMGLSQPLDKEQLQAERATGRSYSAHGFELGFVVPDRATWPIHALDGFVSHITDGVNIKWGDGFAFGFTQEPNGSIAGFTGRPEELGVPPLGNIRAVLFWRYLFPDWEFLTSTWKFMVLVATGITALEWQLAKETTTAHLMLLLHRCGIGQHTCIDRPCLLEDPRWQIEWKKIKGRDPEDCDRELEAGVRRQI
jgi:hypothetical protein